MPTAPFDRRLVRLRAARTSPPREPLLRELIAARLADRLAAIRRRFTTVLELSAADDALERALAEVGLPPFPLHVKVGPVPPPRGTGSLALVADEERLPLAPGRFDLVIALGGLHWVNDLPGTLLQIRAALARDGLLLAAFPGGASLVELRTCLLEAETELCGGAAPRVAPMVDLRDAAALLQRAGFASPVADLESIDLAYRDPWRLLADLRAARETAALAPELRRPLARTVLGRAMEFYRERHRRPDGSHPATLELVVLTGFGGPAGP